MTRISITLFVRQGIFAQLGWVTADEQRSCAPACGYRRIGWCRRLPPVTLARLGIGAFNLADFDSFDLVNFNRQAGAMVSTLGRPKVDVLAAMVRDINPEVDLRILPDGVNSENLPSFFDGIDLYVDGLDFFAFSARKAVFAECARRGIPAITVAPLGMGAALLNFLPGGMTFEEYFCWNGCSEDEMAIRFLLGLSPAMLQRNYLADRSAVDFAGRRGPSTGMACEMCAGIAATEALKILLGRGKVSSAPWGMHFDAYRNRLVRTWRPGGNRNPIQRIAISIARRQLLHK